MFLDASVIIAIVGEEEDADELLARIEATETQLRYSPLSAYEAIVGYARKKHGSKTVIPTGLIEESRKIIEGFLTELGATEMDITSKIGRDAVDACKRFGRQVGHPAKLNFGDCFAYACARSIHAPLLYKGNDFPHTDIG